jgi:hypothetical protein
LGSGRYLFPWHSRASPPGQKLSYDDVAA